MMARILGEYSSSISVNFKTSSDFFPVSIKLAFSVVEFIYKCPCFIMQALHRRNHYFNHFIGVRVRSREGSAYNTGILNYNLETVSLTKGLTARIHVLHVNHCHKRLPIQLSFKIAMFRVNDKDTCMQYKVSCTYLITH